MRNLEGLAAEMERRLDAKEQVREQALKSARALTRLSSEAIRAVHRRVDAAKPLADARRESASLATMLRDHPDLLHGGFAEGACAEFAEASCLLAIVRGEDLPSPVQLGITDNAWLLGLGDAVGELRRLALDQARRGDLAKAEQALESMERIFEALMRFDHPSALLPVRHKQDVARSLLEKTRGELAVFAASRDLEARLTRLKGGAEPAAKKKGDLDLDIDAVWKT